MKPQETQQQYPNKRLIVHFIQPHHPYIGPTGREVFRPNTNMEQSILEADTDRSTLRKAYRENLDIIAPIIKYLIRNLSGKTVLTADHGELLGERSAPVPYVEYGHPKGTYVEKLVRVPWLEFDGEQRREITAGTIQDDHALDDSAIDDRLEALGYIN